MVDFNGEVNAFTDEQWAAHLEREKRVAKMKESADTGEDNESPIIEYVTAVTEVPVPWFEKLYLGACRMFTR